MKLFKKRSHKAGLPPGTVVAVGAKAAGITGIQTGRAPVGSLLWARTLCVGENTATIDFYLGIHGYNG